MRNLQKKVCLLGDFGVGKTSLVSRFVTNEFSEKYLTTVGVKMDSKSIVINNETSVKMIIWDIAGEINFKRITQSYLRGTSGVLLVVDGTRITTLDTALDMKKGIIELLGNIPYAILINKADLTTEWEFTEQHIKLLETAEDRIFFTSARTGENVESAFNTLGYYMSL